MPQVSYWWTGQARTAILQVSIGGALTESVDEAEGFLRSSFLQYLAISDLQFMFHEEVCARTGKQAMFTCHQRKNESQVTDEFVNNSTVCGALLFEEYLLHMKRMQEKLRKENRGCKEW